MDILTRFKSKTQPDVATGCWLWIGHVEHNGYGRFSMAGRMRWAHRCAFELFNGPIPPNHELDHLCRITRCVNPAHLEPVSHAENMRRSPIGAAAMHRNKTDCPKGHPYNEANTLRYRGMRYCRKCTAEHKRAYKRRRRALATSTT